MNILFCSIASSTRMNEQVRIKDNSRYGIQMQKFLNLFITGLLSHEHVSCDVISKYSNRKILNNRFFLKSYSEYEDGVRYNYLPESRFCGYLISFISNFCAVVKWLKINSGGFVLQDGLNITLLISSYIGTRLMGSHISVIVTDLPRFLIYPSGNYLKRFLLKSLVFIWEWFIKQADSFVLLTYEMNNELNFKNKPYVVIEGLADVRNFQNSTVTVSEDINICLYTGSVHRKYGIDKLIKSFSLIKNKSCELHIYGSGDFENELSDFCMKHSNVKFFGIAPNKDITFLQSKAKLLINPRPTTDVYTKFSFPSKLIEYMLSGTPVLTTKLPGIPKEYDPHLFYFQKENILDMSDRIEEILNLPNEMLKAQGLKGREFILSNKNNHIQTGKVVQMLKSCF